MGTAIMDESIKTQKLIEEQMTKQGIRKDLDVTELYLSNQGLTDVCDFGQYRMLNRIWLNGNKLRRINCLSINYRISELYLQDNELVSVAGLLQPLTSLQVLMLHNNQLTDLEETVNEMKAMQALHTLNLSQNPLAQEAEYRHYIIHHVPSLKLLDRQEILKSERDEAAKMYQQDRQSLLETIAFGHRCEGPAQRAKDQGVVSESRHSFSSSTVSDGEVANHFISPPRGTPEDAVAERAVQRSIMEYSHFDWTKKPRAEERRMNKNVEGSKTEIITVRFR
ncbi:leucine-rich repeat-containing protein 72 [Strongylocentrotus purpuratus]|uniref:Leucine-rich repeat-containing protein 72 n=1 Tax=Strongylocentrotus purpuratus TaxID=7668 RepID=A0A7M7HJE8_STRPU|nr:leucine-rich repeat-containing protein 72 [Strongylocentrotus purpuratus]